MSNSACCGDDVGAIVIDFGSNTTRCGYAGQEYPIADLASCAGFNTIKEEHMDKSVDDDVEKGQINSCKNVNKAYCVADKNIFQIRSNIEFKKLIGEDHCYNMDVVEEMLNYIYSDRLSTIASDHPVLFTEPFNNLKINREKLTELIFEKFGAAAMSICKSPVLSSFSSGRTTSLIVDMGHSSTSICPVTDGYCLTKASTTISINGSLISTKVQDILEKKFKIDLVPLPCLKISQRRNLEEPPLYTLKSDLDNIDPNWIQYHRLKLIQDFQQHTLKVSDSNIDDIVERPFTGNFTEYQFPTGYRFNLTTNFHDEYYAYKIPELYFSENLQKHENISPIKSLQAAIIDVVDKCDVDLKPALLNNIIVCGGCSCITGMSDRIYNELISIMSPTTKIKVLTPNSSLEKRFSAWIGGSILSSLGSFQQLWISPTEYKEIGPSCTEVRSVT